MKKNLRIHTIHSVAFVLFFAGMLFVPAFSWAQTTCVDYRTLGMTDCEDENAVSVEEIQAVPPEDQVKLLIRMLEQAAKGEEKPVSKSMDMRVKEYMETYDKPPREFIEFNLNPTLENAVKWTIKRKRMLERNKKLSIAWAQAQMLVQQYEAEGKPLPKLENELPEVPDFGIPLTGNYSGLDRERKLASQAQDIFAEAPGANIVSTNKKTAINGRLGGFAEPLGPVKVDYYYSDQCPFCAKMTPILANLVKKMGKDIGVQCIDMSPKNRKPENIIEKLNCVWRPIFKGEMQEKNITSTPTILIDHNVPGVPPSRSEGLIAADALRKLLTKGR